MTFIRGGKRRAQQGRQTGAAFGLLLLFALPSAIRAQSTADSTKRAATEGGEIRGRIVANGTGQGIPTGSISVRRATDTSFVMGVSAESNGSFHVTGLEPGRYAIRVRAVGFAPLVRSDVTISREHPLADLGTLTLSEFAVKLESQVVTGERQDVALSPDRNSYSTKNMTTAAGGTAVNVLRNVPSVEVDGNNNVSLRGNTNVVVQINGRSSPLTGEQLAQFLAQIPASTVTRVEVSTNPSAKNDPEGTAGIINIVLNQQADIGLSGGLNASTGTTGQANIGGNIGRQSGPLTLYLSASLYQDHRGISGTSDRTNLVIPVPAFVESHSNGQAQPHFSSMTFRSEYKLTENDALSADAMLSGGRFGRQSTAFYSDLDTGHEVIGAIQSDQRPGLAKPLAGLHRRIPSHCGPIGHHTLDRVTVFDQHRFEQQQSLRSADTTGRVHRSADVAARARWVSRAHARVEPADRLHASLGKRHKAGDGLQGNDEVEC